MASIKELSESGALVSNYFNFSFLFFCLCFFTNEYMNVCTYNYKI